MKLGYLLSIASLLVSISGLPTYEIEKRDFSLKDKFQDVKENAEDSDSFKGFKDTYNVKGFIKHLPKILGDLVLYNFEGPDYELLSILYNDTFSYLPDTGRDSSVIEKTELLAKAAVLHNKNLSMGTFLDIGSGLLDALKPKSLKYNLPVFSPKVANLSNNNVHEPKENIYPLEKDDAPYSVSESDLRKGIQFQEGFDFGNSSKKIVLFVPGTGSYGDEASNLGKLISKSDFADATYLNVPGRFLRDAQISSEYVAYAVNYISSVSGDRNISVVGWS